MMATRMFSKLALFGSTALMTATLAHAQDAAAPVAVVNRTLSWSVRASLVPR
jgi:hypothetical protein